MQLLGRRGVRYINDRYRRTGTLWEGRYKKACPIENGDHLMCRHRCIKLNPLRAAMIVVLGDYPLSIHRSNDYGEYEPLFSPHAGYLSLSSALRNVCGLTEPVAPDELDAIRRHVQCQHAYGTNRFRAAIEAQLRRPAGPGKIGRPKKSDEAQRRWERPL